MEQLISDLGPYPVQAIEWALDSWGRNAKVLPAFADLLQLLRSWISDSGMAEKCECTHLHGTGYGVEDLLWLMKKRGEHAERFSISQWEALFAELDAKRVGGPPAWRGTPDGQNFLRVESA
jgi:hypothetical protein